MRRGLGGLSVRLKLQQSPTEEALVEDGCRGGQLQASTCSAKSVMTWPAETSGCEWPLRKAMSRQCTNWDWRAAIRRRNAGGWRKPPNGSQPAMLELAEMRY